MEAMLHHTRIPRLFQCQILPAKKKCQIWYKVPVDRDVEWVKTKNLLEEIDQVNAAGKLCLVEVHKHSNFDEVIASADL